MRLTTRSRPGGGDYVTAGFLLAPIWASVSVIGGLLLVFVLDRATGSAPVQHLYYLPIIFAAVRFRIPGGVTAPLTAIVLYHLANPNLLSFRYEQWDLVQITLFIAVGVITAKLAHDARRLHVLAMTDDLTGLHNLRSFEDRLAAMVRASRESRASLALLVLDVDRLKSLNDEHGHLTGAEAVRTVGHIISARAPHDAVACRYGGDEFVIAIPRCTESRANGVADDLRRAVNAATPVLAGIHFPVTTLSVSVGVVCQSFDQETTSGSNHELGEALFRAADGALYLAKESGRNHVCVA